MLAKRQRRQRMLRLRKILDRIFGQRVPEGIDPRFWASRHNRIHNRPYHVSEWIRSLPRL
jgi:hypothetical protein